MIVDVVVVVVFVVGVKALIVVLCLDRNVSVWCVVLIIKVDSSVGGGGNGVDIVVSGSSSGG